MNENDVWWRLGWEIPEDLRDFAEWMKEIGSLADSTWRKASKLYVPNNKKVSPGKGFTDISNKILEMLNET